MIYYLVTQKYCETLRPFLTHWAKDFKHILRVLTYESLLCREKIKPGTYIFSDIERLTSHQIILFAKLCDFMNNTPGFQAVNHPARSMRRYELLRTLYDNRLNSFNIYRLSELQTAPKFPVFIRWENDHNALTLLLYTQAEFNSAIKKFKGKLNDKVFVEFCDTADGEGVYRKYASYIVGHKIIPIHVMFRNQWFVKSSPPDSPAARKEEMEYIIKNPHEEQLRSIFQMAGINYGRIDYSFHDGRLQVWEINTNPRLIPLKNINQRIEAKHFFIKQYKEALLGMEAGRETSYVGELDLKRCYPHNRNKFLGLLPLFLTVMDHYYFYRLDLPIKRLVKRGRRVVKKGSRAVKKGIGVVKLFRRVDS